MHEDMKSHLEESIPSHMKLTVERKQAILAKAHQRLHQVQPSKKLIFKPILTAVAVLGIAGILTVPYIQQEMRESASEELIPSEHVQKIFIPNVAYPSLITAIYADGTKEMIYTDGKAIYAFDNETNTKKVIIEAQEDGEISGYNVAANKSWIVWKQENAEGYSILNRMSGETREFPEDLHGMQLDGDTLTYTSVGYGEGVWLSQLNLNTLEKKKLHDLSSKRYGQYAVGDGKVILGDEYTKFDNTQMPFSVYELQTNQKFGSYVFPYEHALNLAVTDNKVYASLYNEGEGESPVLGYIDLSNGEFFVVDTPPFHTYAVYHNTLALSVHVKESNTVKLFTIKDNKAHALPTFNHIQERLVKPRFTPGGTLVVNGEGEDYYPMYVVDATEMSR